ncbi:TPA: hypothetical protein ACN322_004571 [Vibrio parahaemolyticus]|uniref:hypothetical protein n=1 Tax=Vibrio TaxID=662 RepID=UPI0004A4BFE4|nr:MULTISPECIES: hypothetical protein [Vibrio]EJE8558689.1 hypothetical protein [Vibrio vulnificus]KON51911.1 hypothetical protein ACX02_20985 [Vibrio parahaemolyticus]MCS0032490.1 hypothetical protein [Vibrio parahaemolyticus]NVD23008.1 hypothetical protein [Vibrio vulnificus]HCG8450792.1 hypothetical protein [Vibrio parahaemolyticus]
MSFVEGKSKEQILEEMRDVAEPGSVVHEQQKAGIIVRSTQDIEDALLELGEKLERSANSSDKMSERIYWLNVVLAAATVVAAIATVVIAFKTP